MTAKTVDPIWSILMATIPNRRAEFARIWDKLETQVREVESNLGVNIEILGFCDNRKRSVGYKRQALLDIARGRYVSYVDDDDDPSCWYVSQIMNSIMRASAGSWPEVIVFPIRVTIDGESDGIVEPSLEYVPKNPESSLEEYRPPVTHRPPHMLCVWRIDVARRGRFPDESFRDDFKWARQVWPYAHQELNIPEVLYWWKGRSNEEATVGS